MNLLAFVGTCHCADDWIWGPCVGSIYSDCRKRVNRSSVSITLYNILSRCLTHYAMYSSNQQIAGKYDFSNSQHPLMIATSQSGIKNFFILAAILLALLMKRRCRILKMSGKLPPNLPIRNIHYYMIGPFTRSNFSPFTCPHLLRKSLLFSKMHFSPVLRPTHLPLCQTTVFATLVMFVYPTPLFQRS